jgi:hypothetical protein
MTKRRPETVIDQSDASWHWDKKVPIALIATLFLTFAGQGLWASWWASKMESRIEFLEKAHATAGPQSANQGERLTRVEEKLEGVKAGITDIKTLLTAQDLRDRNNKAVR